MRTGIANRYLPAMGIQVGLVLDNKDPEGRHRILVEFPSDSVDGPLESFWCRIVSPMAGADRGLVMIPDIGTEVVIGFATRSLNPYILGAVYNGKDDKPEPYKNDDEENNIRIFWSRNDHMVLFDDTEGEEKVGIGAQASERLTPTSGVVYHDLDSSKKIIQEYCDGSSTYTAKSTLSVKCTTASVVASNSISMSAGSTTDVLSGANINVQAGSSVSLKGVPKVNVNKGTTASPKPALQLVEAKHPPKE
ncbi:MAG: hypothetical protein CMK59_01255 [Proteobacteria bacterium]|nr:hypothetical protein [Pseudomonadota bacterium]